jgi:Spy/CpxP family protein refolding chaperone
MKPERTAFPKTLSVLLVTGLLGTLIVTAAESTGDAPARERPARADRPAGGAGGAPFRGAMLTDQQREVMRESMQTHAPELRKLTEKMRAAEKELMQAIMAEKQDEKVIREKAEAVAKIQVEETMLRAKMFAPVVPTLTQEQREQFENSPLALRMMGGGFGGGMRGGGGAGGDRPPRGQRPAQ